MSEETTTQQEQPAEPKAPVAPAAPQAQDPETEHAVKTLEEKKERLKAKAAPEKPKEEAKPEEASKPEKPPAEQARKAYQERAAKRAAAEEESQRIRAIQAENERLRQEREEWARFARESFGPQEESGLPNFKENPQAWYQAAFDRALDERIGPLLQRFQAEDEARMTWQQQQQQQAAAQAAYQGLISSVAQAEDEYEATAEGSGYKERFDRYVRGRAKELQGSGKNGDQVAGILFSEILGMFQIAASSGEHPAYFIDNLIRHHPLAQGNGSNGSETTLAPKNSPVVDLQKTAAAPGVSGSLSRGGAAEPSGAADVKSLVRRGQVKTDDLRALVNAKAGSGTSVRARVRESLRQIETLADAQGK